MDAYTSFAQVYDMFMDYDNKQSIREISPDMQRMMQTAGKVLRE